MEGTLICEPICEPIRTGGGDGPMGSACYMLQLTQRHPRDLRAASSRFLEMRGCAVSLDFPIARHGPPKAVRASVFRFCNM